MACSSQQAADSPQEVIPEVIKGSSDHRQYRYIELPNSLKVLLISDQRADKSAAALDIFVGSQDEPAGREGLAHFLEHMLFLGTDKYPESDEYQAFISAHGGSHNAYTSSEHTNYFFDIAPDYFEQGLDRFSRFFVAPLFNDTYVQRERNAVNSEYLARIKSEGRRQLDALRQVMNPEHPASRFSVGSLETLRDTEQQTLQQSLIAFYQQNYAASNMALVVLSPDSLDQQEILVRDKFKDVPDFEVIKAAKGEPYFKPDQLPLLLEVVPEEQTRELTLVFPIPDDRKYYQRQSFSYIANLLGHEGGGSLLAALKECGWADSLSAGKGFGDGEQATFNVTISLTEKGLANWQLLPNWVFDYIQLIDQQGIESWRYAEQSNLALQQFNYRAGQRAMSTVTGLAGRLHQYSPEYTLQGPFLMQQFLPQDIAKMLGFLVADNMLLVKVDKGVKSTQSTRYYQVPYAVSRIPKAIYSSSEHKQACQASLHLPEVNPFVAESLELVELPSKSIPRKLSAASFPAVDAWYAEDYQFRLPKAQVYGELAFPQATSLREAALMAWLLSVVNDNLNKHTYPAMLAGLGFHLSQEPDGLVFTVGGFSDKLPLLAGELVAELMSPALNLADVDRVKQSLRQNLFNTSKEEPYRQVFSLMNRHLIPGVYDSMALYEQLGELDIQALRDFSASLQTREKTLLMLMAGNLSRMQAAELVNQTAGAVGRLVVRAEYINHTMRLTGSDAVGMQVDHSDQTYLRYIQSPVADYTSAAEFILLRQLLKAPFFNELRTEQQLGYIVSVVDGSVDDLPGMAFLVQSPTATLKQLDQAVAAFLSNYQQVLSRLSEADFVRSRQAAVTRLREKPTNMSEQARRYWGNLQLQEDGFTRREKIIGELEALSLSDMIASFQRHVLAGDRQVIFTAAAVQ